MRRTLVALVAWAPLALPLVLPWPAAAQQPLTEKGIQDRLNIKVRGLPRPTDAATTPPAPVTTTMTPRPAAVAAPRPCAGGVATANAPALDFHIAFGSGSAELTPDSRGQLDVLGRALSGPTECDYRFRLEGYTDTVGTPAANKALSERRAQTVAAYLARSHGIAASRLTAIGFGEENPAVPTPDETSEPRNRRVRIVNLDG